MAYDKAKYHFESCDEAGLDEHQAYVHTGMFVTWLIQHDLMSELHLDESTEGLASVKARTLTGPHFFATYMDGVLTDEDLSDEGNAFAAAYLDFEQGKYLADYHEILSNAFPSELHVPDTWENYDRLAPRIDDRYAAFGATRS